MSAALALALVVAAQANVEAQIGREEVLRSSAIGGAIGAAGPVAVAACGLCAMSNGNNSTGSAALGCALLSYGCTSSAGAAIGAWTATRDKRGGGGALVGGVVGTTLGVLGTGAMIGGAFVAFEQNISPLAIVMTCSGLGMVLGAAPTGVCISTLMTDDVGPSTKRELPPTARDPYPRPDAAQRPPPPPLLDEMQF